MLASLGVIVAEVMNKICLQYSLFKSIIYSAMGVKQRSNTYVHVSVMLVACQIISITFVLLWAVGGAVHQGNKIVVGMTRRPVARHLPAAHHSINIIIIIIIVLVFRQYSVDAIPI